jgi:hypothetical protein
VTAATTGPAAAGEPAFAARLAVAGAAVGALPAAADGLGAVTDEALLGVMGELTTLVGRLDGLRVAVAARVRQREAYRRAGAASVAGWLRADPRTADVASALAQLSARASELPQVMGLLGQGRVSLAQAAAVCWQIARLPASPAVPPPTNDPPPPPPTGDQPAPPAADDPSKPPPAQDQSPAGEPPGSLDDPGGSADELWAGLWRRGDVHAAADELFAGFMPRLDGAGLRTLGAHLREAADAQERVGEDYGMHARRCLRIASGFGGVGEVSGRLAPEAAGQVLAAFTELGGKAGPDDDRTKAQRWADVLVYLTSLALPPPGPACLPDPTPDPTPRPRPAATAADPAARSWPGSRPWPGPASPATPASSAVPGAEADDDQPCPDGGHGHDISPSAGTGLAAGVGNAGTGVVPVGLRRPRVIVTVPLASLLGQPLSPGAVLGAGTPITGQSARRLACDADIIRLITTPAGMTGATTAGPPCPACGQPPGSTGSGPPRSTGTGSPATPGARLPSRPPSLPQTGTGTGPPDPAEPGPDATGALTQMLAAVIASLPRPLGASSAALDIGRASPAWTPRQRDALHASYGGCCSAPGCTRPIEVIHHIVHWAHGGPTSVANGAPFCGYHHWLVHEGGWQVTKHTDGAITLTAPPPGWRPGTIYRCGKPVRETMPHTHAV